jgi:hypothetical protein
MLGIFDPGESPSAELATGTGWGVTPVTSDVYAYGPSYTSLSGVPSTTMRLTVGVGAVTPAQAAAIGQMLVADGQAQAYIRIMWEMNESGTCWFPWGLNCIGGLGMTDATYISTFQEAATAFRSVPGSHFQIVWNINGAASVPAAAYPGDSYVDQVGADQYDYSGYSSNLSIAIAFAKAHGKALQIDEWGVMGHDDPAYINGMATLMHAAGSEVSLEVYFNNATNVLSDYPSALAAYKADFG